MKPPTLLVPLLLAAITDRHLHPEAVAVYEAAPAQLSSAYTSGASVGRPSSSSSDR